MQSTHDISSSHEYPWTCSPEFPSKNIGEELLRSIDVADVDDRENEAIFRRLITLLGAFFGGHGWGVVEDGDPLPSLPSRLAL